MKKAKTATQVWITPAMIQEASIKLFGENWRLGFREFFDMSYSQLHRYMAVYNGQTVPKSVALALDMALTLKANDLELPTLKDWITPIADVKPLLFVPEKKPKVVRPNNDAPEIDLFGDPEPTETEQKQDAPETKPATEPEPNRTETETKPDPKPDPKPAKKPAKKPASKPKAKPAAPAKPKAKAPAKPKAKAKA